AGTSSLGSARRALRRRDAAGRYRARARDRAEAHPRRRADGEPRLWDGRADPRPHLSRQPRARRHRRDGHARCEGGCARDTARDHARWLHRRRRRTVLTALYSRPGVWRMERMRPAALLLVVALAACGGSSSDRAAGPRPRTPGVRMTMDTLHRLGGVPPGWKLTPPPGDVAAGRAAFV